MSTILTLYTHPTFGSLRTIVDRESIYICAKDAATALGYTNTHIGTHKESTQLNFAPTHMRRCTHLCSDCTHPSIRIHYDLLCSNRASPWIQRFPALPGSVRGRVFTVPGDKVETQIFILAKSDKPLIDDLGTRCDIREIAYDRWVRCR